MPDPQQVVNASERRDRGLNVSRSIAKNLNFDSRASVRSSNGGDDSSKCDIENNTSGDSSSDLSCSRTSRKRTSLTGTDSSDKSSVSSGNGTVSLTSWFRRLSLMAKSKKEKPTQKHNKSILRSPVYHVHVRGISGLPTHRVPVSSQFYKHPRRYYSAMENRIKI